MAQGYGAERPRKRRGRRLLITVIVLLVILGAGLLVLDRVAASYAERVISDRVAQQVANQEATSEKPDVTIDGVPFLAQVASGRYRQINIKLANFSGPVGNGRTVKLPLLDVRANDVRAPLSALRSGKGDVVASTVTGTGTIAYAELVTLIGQPGLQLAEKNGKLVASAPVQALGRTFNVTGTADLTVNNGVVRVRFSEVTADQLPNIPVLRGLLNSYAGKLGLDLRVPPLPLKLAVQKVEPHADGLQFTAGARDVPLRTSGL